MNTNKEEGNASTKGAPKRKSNPSDFPAEFYLTFKKQLFFFLNLFQIFEKEEISLNSLDAANTALILQPMRTITNKNH